MPRPSSSKDIPFLPEGVSNPSVPDKPWTTSESSPVEARVDLLECLAWVPRNVNAYTDLIHWHELFHVKWNEGSGIFGRTEPGVWDHILKEPQVNILGLREIKIDVAQAMRAFDFDEHPVPLLARDAGILWINLAYYLKDADNDNLRRFARKLEEKIREGWEGHRAFQTCFDAVQEVIKKPSPTTRQTWAVKLAEYFNPPPPPPILEGDLTKDTADGIKEADDAAKETEEREREQIKDEIDAQLGRGSRIDTMQIHEHLTRSRPGQRIASPGGVRDTGIVPVKFERYCTDRMLFQIRKPTGSLVIDCSGSMAWDWTLLRDGLQQFPNVTVGCYQGFSNDLAGRLCVIAKKARWSDYEPEKEPGGLAGNNTVDYPALLWLAKQPAPRVWLSDGQICGGSRTNNRVNVDAIMKKAKIIRVETLEAALRYFGRKEVPGFTTSGHGSAVITRRRR